MTSYGFAKTCQFRIVGRDHAAFTAADDMGRIKTEEAHRAEGPHDLAADGSTVCFASVFDDEKIVAFGDRQDLTHLARLPHGVHYLNGFCLRGDDRFD